MYLFRFPDAVCLLLLQLGKLRLRFQDPALIRLFLPLRLRKLLCNRLTAPADVLELLIDLIQLCLKSPPKRVF